MPQVSKEFYAYPVTVTLDGSGNGAVQFQAVGANLRIDNISVRVSTANAQATATLFRGQIGQPFRISGTNSGSTGDNVSQPIDIRDGDSVIVQWVGGDPGATATATFSGKHIPKGDVGSAVGGSNWTSPIAAGDGSLIYPSLKSPNYTTALAGWMISRDGNAEFNSVTVRGSVVVADVDGSRVEILANDGGKVRFYPDNTPGVTVVEPGEISSSYSGTAASGYAFMTFNSPEVNTGSGSVSPGSLFIAGELTDGTNFPGMEEPRSYMSWNGDLNISGGINTFARIKSTVDNQLYLRGQRGTATFTNLASGSSTFTISVTYPVPFDFADIPNVQLTMVGSSGQASLWSLRVNNLTRTGFDIVGSRPSNTSAVFSPRVDWTAVTDFKL
jgi:hypothetical protein